MPKYHEIYQKAFTLRPKDLINIPINRHDYFIDKIVSRMKHTTAMKMIFFYEISSQKM